MVTALLETDQLERATHSAHIIQYPPVKVLALHNVAEGWIARGGRVKAKELVSEALERAGTNGNSLGWVAYAYAQIGDISVALDIASRIPGEFDRSSTYQGIADIQSQHGEATSALTWAVNLKSPYEKSSALLGVAFGILQKYGIDVRGSVL